MAKPRLSPTTHGATAVRVMRARVVDVDTRTFAVKLRTEVDGRIYENVQSVSPYYHYAGEGFFALPDLDAQCLVLVSSDDTPPTIIGYTDLPSVSSQSELEAEAGNQVPEQGQDEESLVSYAGAKPRALPGDVGFIGRDGNFTFWRKGGLLQEGASAFCQRMYLPIKNQIRDIAEGYALTTVGGDLLMESLRAEDSDDSAAGFRTRLFANENLEDAKASFLLELGKLGEQLLRMAICPQGIDRATGQSTTTNLIELTMGKDGKTILTTADWDQTVTGSRTTTIAGSDTTRVTGDVSVYAGNSTETCTTKKICAPSIQLTGRVDFGGAGQPLCGNAYELQAYMTSHRHDPVTGQPIGYIPNIVMLNLLA